MIRLSRGERSLDDTKMQIPWLASSHIAHRSALRRFHPALSTGLCQTGWMHVPIQKDELLLQNPATCRILLTDTYNE